MGGDGGPPPPSDRPPAAPSSEHLQWQRIFGALLEMLRQRQGQVETLAGDRKFLQDYVHLQHSRWASKTLLLESQISQIRKEGEMGKRVEEAKLGLMVALKQMECSCYKELAEDADDVLQDFYECAETLSCQIFGLKEKLEEGKGEGTDGGARGQGEEINSSGLREFRKWKQAYKQLSSTKEAEVSALLAEKDFVWHQLKKMESDYTTRLKSKEIEVEQSNEALEKLQANVEKLQSSASDKDEMIDKLKADICRIELELRSRTREAQMNAEEVKELHLDMEKLQSSIKEKDGIIAKLQDELAKRDMHIRQCSNRRSRLSKSGGSVTPAERHQGIAVSRSSCFPRKSSGSGTAEMGLRRPSKRKSMVSMSKLDRPKLFPSTFKVPKLKNMSPAPV